MKIHCLQNSEVQTSTQISIWARERGHNFICTKLCSGEFFNSQSEDMLVILGGKPIDAISWLPQEVNYIRRSIQAGIKVIGFGLGAQLIAEALGGKMVPHNHSEYGWWPVVLNRTGMSHPLLAGLQLPELFFFHRNTVILPDTFSLLASNVGCRNQVFSFNDRVLGIQGHPEFDEKIIRNLSADRINYIDNSIFVNRTINNSRQHEKISSSRLFLWKILDNLSAVN